MIKLRQLPSLAEAGNTDASAPTVRSSKFMDDESEWRRLIDYLSGATTLLAAPGTEYDPLDRGRGPVVSINVVTDGEWTWSDSWRYFVQTYRVAPPEEFMAHVRAREFVVRELSDEEIDALYEGE